MSNYRVAVEIIIRKNSKVLIGKRSETESVAPGAWCMPAGKVEYDEVPKMAVIREAKEETGLDVDIIAEISCHTTSFKKGDEDAYRLVFTYLVEPKDKNQQEVLNFEHSEFAWVDESDLNSGKYNTLLPDQIKRMIKGLNYD